MNRKHKHRSQHRAAAFTQARPIQHPIAMDYHGPISFSPEMAAWMKKYVNTHTKDRHPITLEKLDGE